MNLKDLNPPMRMLTFQMAHTWMERLQIGQLSYWGKWIIETIFSSGRFFKTSPAFYCTNKILEFYKEEEIQLAEFQTKSKNPVDIAYKGGWEINTYKAQELNILKMMKVF